MIIYIVKVGWKVDYLKEGLGIEVGMMIEKINIDWIIDKKIVVWVLIEDCGEVD